MADAIDSLVTWLGRYVFMILFGNQFRRAPLTIHGLLALFVFYEVKELAEKRDVSFHDHSMAEVFDKLGMLPWLQTVLNATLSVALLNHQVYEMRCLYRACCVMVLCLLTSITGWSRMGSHVLPFVTSVPFWMVFTISAAYHYRNVQIPLDSQSWQNATAKFIRAMRRQLKNEVGPSQKQKKAAIVTAQEDKARELRDTTATQENQANVERLANANRSLQQNGVASFRKPLYKKLPADGIRLLTIVGSQEQRSGLMAFTMEHTTLSTVKDSYTALSYCWGNASQTRKILIDGILVEVTKNLHDALQETLALGYKRLWIDAICINQSDLLERNTQVLRIFWVFQSAKEVVAWLGREDEGSKRVMLELKAKAEEAPANGRKNSCSMDDLKRFMEYDFWRRIWIIQELAAARRVYLICCRELVCLESLRTLLDETFEWEKISKTNWPRFLEERQLIQNILDIRERRTDPTRPLCLLEALTKTKASESTQIHDRVYGLLGLVNDHKYYIPEPNYQLTSEQLCFDMTLFWIRERRSLDIILAAPRRGPRTLLPSWCPDYLNAGTVPFNEHIVKYISGHEKHHRLGEEGYYWKTTESSNAMQGVTFELDDRMLLVSAVPVGVIDAVGPLRDQDDLSQHGEYNRHFGMRQRAESQLIQLHGRNKSDSSIQFHSPYNAMCRLLLIYDKSYTKFAAKPIVLGMLYHFLGIYRLYAASKGGSAEEVQGWLDLNQNFKVHGTKLKDRAQNSAWRMSSNFVKGLFGQQTRTMMFMHYDRVTKTVHKIIDEGMRLMTTQEGGVGFAHPEARTYDKIYMIAGCSLPVVLRESEEELGIYRVVGHAYVDGYMDGKKWENMKDRLERVRIV